jgi:2-dehydro-3-deoxygluconokinase
MKTIVIMGESMLELSRADVDLWQQSYAGDVHSLAVYLKRCAGEFAAVTFMSAVGTDALSQNLLSALEAETVNTALVYRHPSKQLGLYMINTSPSGERSFQYWRNDSAARQMMQLHSSSFSPNSFTRPDQVFFSGITLAILDKNTRADFWNFIDWLKAEGTQIIFDPNYREKLWSSPEDARAQYDLAFKASNLLLPGVDDFHQLYNLHTSAAVCDFLMPYNIDEIIIKNGAESVIYQSSTEQFSVPIIPVAQVVDTTAAGDSFNGSYLAARARGLNTKDAILFASKISALVIQHRGAILNKELFTRHLQQLSL